MKHKLQIIVVEDETLFRKSVSLMLTYENNFEVIYEASNGQEIIDYLDEAKRPLPDIILMDIKMPKVNGIEATKYITEKYPSIKIIILTTYNTEAFVTNIIDIGASGYISKNALPEEMIHCIHLVHHTGFYYKEAMLKYISKESPVQNHSFNRKALSAREIEVLKLICQQKSATEIAKQLFISPRTVDGHRNRLLEKTNSKNIAGLVLFAIQHQLFLFD